MESFLRVIDAAEMERVLTSARTIAVLGIKPESRSTLDAHQLPLYLQKVGYLIVPVPTRYPEATAILGLPVVRRLGDLPKPVDVLSIFVKPEHLTVYIDDILALRPGVVWFQSGLLRPDLAEPLARAGLRIAEDCIACRRASIEPSWAPLPSPSGQAPEDDR
jgi:uncharacterized protein